MPEQSKNEDTPSVPTTAPAGAAPAAPAATPAAKPANPFQAAPHSKKLLTLIGVYVAVIATGVHSSSLTTLLPVAAMEIGGLEYYSLANTVIGVLSIAAMPLYGYLGARRPEIKAPLFAASLLIGAIVIFLRTLAPSMILLIIPSALYGLSSAGLFVLGYSIVREMYDPKKAGTYLGVTGTMMAVGLIVGPVACGLIMDTVGWRPVCHVIWPIFLVAAVLILCGVKVSREDAAPFARTGGSFDFAGAFAVVVFLGALILALSLGTSFFKFGGMVSNCLFAVSAVALIALVLIIRKKQARAIIPATACKDRNTLCFTLANFFSNFSNMVVFFFLPLYILKVMQGSATEASLTTTFMAIVPLFMSPVFGKMIGKSGNARGVLASSTILRIIVAIALLVVLSPSCNIWVVYAVMFIAGFYRAAQSTSFSAGPQIQLKPEVRVQSNSVIQVGQNLGGSTSVAVYTLVIGMYGVSGGTSIALVISAVTAAIAFVCAMLLKKLD